MASISSTFNLATPGGEDVRVQVDVHPGDVALTVQAGDNDPVVVAVDAGNRRTVRDFGYAVVKACDLANHQPAERRRMTPAEFAERFAPVPERGAFGCL